VRVIGVNAGYAFSFVRDAAITLAAAVAAEGSQSLGILFPQAAAIAGQPDARREDSPSDIPDAPELHRLH